MMRLQNKILTPALLATAILGGMALSSPALAAKEMHSGSSSMHHGGGHWKSTLTDEQRTQMRALKLTYKKQVIPIKAKLKEAKVELALLLGTDNPSQSALDKKISAIVKLKEQKLQAKAKHKVAVRKVLTPEQRVMFDLGLLKKAYKGKKSGGGGYHNYHH